jgi:hypothetical protein
LVLSIYLETLTSLSKIINKDKKKLESNIIIEKNIFDIIVKQLNFTVYTNFN